MGDVGDVDLVELVRSGVGEARVVLEEDQRKRDAIDVGVVGGDGERAGDFGGVGGTLLVFRVGESGDEQCEGDDNERAQHNRAPTGWVNK